MSEAAGDGFVEYLKNTGMPTSWHSYPKLYAIGHRALAELLLDDVVVEEKLDGSQFSVKNYNRFGPDKKVLMGKFVSEAFKEIHQGEWRAANPTKADIVTAIVQAHRTPARWAKAVQHLRERGQITDSPKDIGALIKEAQSDIEAECKQDILDALWAYAWPQIARGVIGGLPDWYKEELMKRQFENELTDNAALVSNPEVTCS